MQYNKLGRTGIDVSRICLGTMTFGKQNTQDEGFEQMDYALEHGVNFFDSAEMYSFPASPETQGMSERILGNWMAERKNRDKVVVATKITGPGDRFGHIRGGDLDFSARHIAEAVDNSLQRLKTDYIDLYQTHWPDRSTNYFGQLGYTHEEGKDGTAFEETLEGLDAMVKAGKIRAYGSSNEVPWGVMKMLSISERDNLPRMASIQNPYSLLNRTFEVGLAEVAIREDCGLFGYSPLGFGTLTGKYMDGARPEGARLTLFPNFKRNLTERAIAATEKYVNLARAHDLDPAQMAIAFVNSRQFLTSNIIGATTMEQLESNIAADDLVLSDTVLEEIDKIHAEYPNPAP